MDYKKIIKSRTTRVKIISMLGFVPDKAMVKLQYRIKTGRKLNLDNPQRFTEKLQWYKLFYRDSTMARCADKASVREYVKGKGLEHILNEVYGVYEDVDAINLNALQNKFVMKDTLGAGGASVLICKDKANTSSDELLSLARQWLSIGIEKVNAGREWIYCKEKHRVIIEKFIGGEEGIDDWKFFCFNGEPQYIYFITDRKLGNEAQLGVFDSDFNKLPVKRVDERPLEVEVKKPENFDEMMRIARTLSADFPEVRIDLYSDNGKIIFGEMTFFDGSGYMKFDPDSFDYEMGEKFVLPDKKLE